MHCRRNSAFKGDATENEPESQGLGDVQAEREKETASTLALQQLIARVLIDPGTAVPLDSNNLHKKVESWPIGMCIAPHNVACRLWQPKMVKHL